MGAPLGFKTFATGDVLTAADTNGYLMQGVWTFASATARDAAVTSPQEGNVCYLKDTDAVMTYSGSAWVAVGTNPTWTSYTPTLNNVTVGNGTVDFKYLQIGKIVFVMGKFTLGSTSSLTGFYPTVPVTANMSNDRLCAELKFTDSGVGAWLGFANFYNGGFDSSVSYTRAISGNTGLSFTSVSATVPFTFGTNDSIEIKAWYIAA